MHLNSNIKFDFTYLIAQQNHVDSICEISDEQLGKGYLTKESLFQKIDNQNIVFKIVQTPSKVVGFYILHILTQNSNIFQNLGIQKLKNDSSSLIIKTIAISDAFQNKGITTHILKEAEEIAAQNNIDTLYCFAWQHQHTKAIPMSNILIKNDYHQIQVVNDFWKEDSVLRNFECPICNTPPCLCSLVIFEKNI